MRRSTVFLWMLLVASALVVLSCSSTKKGNKMSEDPDNGAVSVSIPGPPVIVYKTKKDYFDKVPVTLSDDKSRIVGFPAPSDLKVNGKFTYPTRLKSGYLLDNRGIGKNTAFLRFSYEDYYNMDNIPTAERLFNYIIDKDPFVKLYTCGKKGEKDNLVEMLNRQIESGEIESCLSLLSK